MSGKSTDGSWKNVQFLSITRYPRTHKKIFNVWPTIPHNQTAGNSRPFFPGIFFSGTFFPDFFSRDFFSGDSFSRRPFFTGTFFPKDLFSGDFFPGPSFPGFFSLDSFQGSFFTAASLNSVMCKWRTCDSATTLWRSSRCACIIDVGRK